MRAFLVTLLISTSIMAQSPAELFKDETQKISGVLNQSNHMVWNLETIRLRVVLELGIEIPLMSKFSLNPEVEFYFVKAK